MSDQTMDLTEYLTKGVEDIVKDVLKATLFDPKESASMAKFALAAKKATEKRGEWEEKGEHIPPFLIASISSSCNLHCAGCYAWVNQICSDDGTGAPLTGKEWGRVFSEAGDLGISFILLAGGEPMMRRDVLLEAAKIPEILFPVFTNGTLINENTLKLFSDARNLVPILSIEGTEKATDERRGEGVYKKLISAMDLIREKHLIFGASVTVTTQNMEEVTGEEFLCLLKDRGCKAVIYVEYVPVSEEDDGLALEEEDRERLQKKVEELRGQEEDLLFISFPGDEKISGGCLAAGRGLFHINAYGGAEPCPFSPYSDCNIRDTSVLEALHSGLFTSLREGGYLTEDHAGGCVLFEERDRVESLMEK